MICFLVCEEIIHKGGDFGAEYWRDRVGLFAMLNRKKQPRFRAWNCSVYKEHRV